MCACMNVCVAGGLLSLIDRKIGQALLQQLSSVLATLVDQSSPVLVSYRSSPVLMSNRSSPVLMSNRSSHVA